MKKKLLFFALLAVAAVGAAAQTVDTRYRIDSINESRWYFVTQKVTTLANYDQEVEEYRKVFSTKEHVTTFADEMLQKLVQDSNSLIAALVAVDSAKARINRAKTTPTISTLVPRRVLASPTQYNEAPADTRRRKSSAPPKRASKRRRQ